jgi:hypothetical protein
MAHLKDSIKLLFAWILTAIAGLSLNDWAIILAIVYSLLQITSFFYPWHKLLWKKLGFKG